MSEPEPFGWVILRKTDKRDGGLPPFDDEWRPVGTFGFITATDQNGEEDRGLGYAQSLIARFIEGSQERADRRGVPNDEHFMLCVCHPTLKEAKA